MTAEAPDVATTVSTGNAEIDKKAGGGIPIGSLTLIEGQSDAGKSVVSQHLTFGALLSGMGVVYYTTENTVRSLLTQMASLGLDVTDYFLLDRLRVYPLQISSQSQEMDSSNIFSRIATHIQILPGSFKVIVVDSVTNIVTHSMESNVIDFFLACKGMCDDGRTIFTVVHSYAFDESMLIRVRSLSRIHRRSGCERYPERAKGCSSESGIMGLKQEPNPGKGAPNRCYHATTPTVSVSPSTTTAWWPMPG